MIIEVINMRIFYYVIFTIIKLLFIHIVQISKQ